MKRKWIALLLVGQFVFSGGPAFAEEQVQPVSQSNTPSSIPVPVTLSRQDVKAQVKASREDLYRKMPYLDPRIIQEIISPRQVQDKESFISSKDQKSLNEVIHRSIQSNTLARASWEKIELARRKIVVALRNLFPEGSMEHNRKGGLLSESPFHSGSYHFKFRQPIFHGGMLWNTFIQSQAELEASENEYDSVIGELIRDVSKAYFDYNRAKQQVQDHGDALKSLVTYQKISAEKYKANIISEIENLNAQSLYGQLEYEYETSKQELELAKLELQKFMNLQMQDDIDVKAIYNMKTLFTGQENPEKGIFNFAQEAPVMKIDELVDMAYQNRPELRVESSKLESARLAQKIKWGKLMPQADVTLEFGQMGEAFEVNDPAPKWRKEFRCMVEFNWNAGGNKVGYTFDHDERAPSVTQVQQQTGSFTRANKISVGILDSLNDYVDAKQADIQKIEQVVELEKAEKKIIQDVKQAYFDYQKNEIQVKSVLQKANYRKRLGELSKHRLDQNEIQVSEYLQAELDLLEELSKLHKAIADYLTARAAMNYAIGVPDYLKFGDINGADRSAQEK